MTTAHGDSPDDMGVDHVELYVEDFRATTDWLLDSYGLVVEADNEAEAGRVGARSVALGRDRIRVVLTQGLAADHPAARYVERHGDGVADIGLRVPDAAGAFEAAVGLGATPVAPPATRDGVVTASIVGFGDVAHTFVQRARGIAPTALPGLRPVPHRAPARDTGLTAVDHFAVCLEAGTLEPTVAFYQRVLGFRMVFAEQILVGRQSMISKVVQSRSGEVTLTLIEPDPSHDPGQIDDFLRKHDGPGVQHIAWNTGDIVRSVGGMASAGVEFLRSPGAYYDALGERMTARRHSVAELRAHNILMDQDHDGQLFQIFTRSVHSRGTLFLELIERLGARTFGSGNIKALYEAVESQRAVAGAR
ncbi:4-hydroxyphenylpyruvate dioxygenase [Streptacidiphilus albus]|uniref:4-hydroxyphenylpyruvate dioxygenase n=1 Tax=Streptacidiphilus albus TaxID=105425 RepID=UPI00054B7F82|nr:4-hydroxyphenylpyruvate dioxygenase [Streptacidiphilus albus]